MREAGFPPPCPAVVPLCSFSMNELDPIGADCLGVLRPPFSPPHFPSPLCKGPHALSPLQLTVSASLLSPPGSAGPSHYTSSGPPRPLPGTMLATVFDARKSAIDRLRQALGCLPRFGLITPCSLRTIPFPGQEFERDTTYPIVFAIPCNESTASSTAAQSFVTLTAKAHTVPTHVQTGRFQCSGAWQHVQPHTPGFRSAAPAQPCSAQCTRRHG